MIAEMFSSEWYDAEIIQAGYTEDRPRLEWLVYHTLKSESPCITISRGRELLGFDSMQKMREWMRNYEKYTKEARCQ